jgi:hypothetical protein
MVFFLLAFCYKFFKEFVVVNGFGLMKRKVLLSFLIAIRKEFIESSSGKVSFVDVYSKKIEFADSMIHIKGGIVMRRLVSRKLLTGIMSVVMIVTGGMVFPCSANKSLKADGNVIDHDHMWVRDTDAVGWICGEKDCNAWTDQKPEDLNDVLDFVSYSMFYRFPNMVIDIENVYKGASVGEGTTVAYITEESVITPQIAYKLGSETFAAGTPIYAEDFKDTDGSYRKLDFCFCEDGTLIADWNMHEYHAGEPFSMWDLYFIVSDHGSICPITHFCRQDETTLSRSALDQCVNSLYTNGLSATGGNFRQVKLTWKESQGAEGYLIYGIRGGSYGYVGMTRGNTTFTDTKAVPGEYNYYWVFPYITYPSTKLVTGYCMKYVYATGGTLPAAENLKASSIKGGVKLSWNSVSGAEGYLVYGIVDGKPYGYVGMTTKGTAFTDKTASKTQYNYYWVFPYFKDSNGKMIVGKTGKYTYGRAL